ncbi:hypothetical protein JCM10212_003683 [Sporobolomyces blumeae]
MTSISSYSTRARPPNPLAADPEWVHRRFERAVDIIQSLPKSGPIQTNYDDKLLLYAVYKQATEGDIKTSRPGIFDVLGRAKWDAWNKRKGLSQQDAERMYVEALIRILRGFSDRTQAVELMRELENFTLTPPRPGGSKVPAPGSFAPSRSLPRGSSRSTTSSTESSSTESYDDDVRRPYATSRSRSNLTPQAARRHHRNRVPPPADLVAPPLPGYGPPRTRQDSVRTPDQVDERFRDRRRGGNRRDARAIEGTNEDSDDYTSDEDAATGPYASMPATAPPSVAQPFPPRTTSTMPPPPFPRPAANPRAPSPPPSLAVRNYPPASLHSFAQPGGSPAPSIHSLAPHHSAHQAVQYPATYVPPLPPLTSSNLLHRSALSTPVPPVAQSAAPSAAAAAPGLDAALDRIQTSLTALHERLSILESSPTAMTSSSRTGVTDPTSVRSLLKQTLIQFLAVLHLRSSRTSATAGTSPPRLSSLVPRLLLAVLRLARKVAGDVVVLAAVVVVLGRIRGVDMTSVVGNWLVRYLVGRNAKGGGKLLRGSPERNGG